MILVTDEQRARYHDAGLWGEDSETHTLDGLLRRNAAQNPEQLAFVDAPNRDTWTSGAPRRLTWAALNREVNTLATFILGLGLPTDSVIALYGPNTVDMAVSILAIQRAGSIAAPMPLFWREAEMRDYLSEVQARAIITSDRLEDDYLALRCRDLTLGLFSVKYILGFGDHLPDGVVNLDQILPSVSEMIGRERAFEEVIPDSVITVHPAALQSPDTEIALPRSSNQWLSAERAVFGVTQGVKHTLMPFSFSGFTGFCAGIVHTLQHCGTTHFHHFQTDNTFAGHFDIVKPELVLLPQRFLANQMRRFSFVEPLYVGCVWKNDHLADRPFDAAQDHVKLFDITVLNEVVALGQLRPSGAMPLALPFADGVHDVGLRLRGPNNDKLKQQKLAGGELVATGASVPEALFSSNSEKRALTRLRNKTANQSAYTHIGCRLSGETGDKCEPIGFLIETIQNSTQVVAAAELDELYKTIPNIIDAAYFIEPASGALNVAVVANGPAPTADDFKTALLAMGVCHIKIPVSVFPTDEIKRGLGGMVMRHELLSLSERIKAKQVFAQRQQGAI